MRRACLKFVRRQGVADSNAQIFPVPVQVCFWIDGARRSHIDAVGQSWMRRQRIKPQIGHAQSLSADHPRLSIQRLASAFRLVKEGEHLSGVVRTKSLAKTAI